MRRFSRNRCISGQFNCLTFPRFPLLYLQASPLGSTGSRLHGQVTAQNGGQTQNLSTSCVEPNEQTATNLSFRFEREGSAARQARQTTYKRKQSLIKSSLRRRNSAASLFAPCAVLSGALMDNFVRSYASVIGSTQRSLYAFFYFLAVGHFSRNAYSGLRGCCDMTRARHLMTYLLNGTAAVPLLLGWLFMMNVRAAQSLAHFLSERLAMVSKLLASCHLRSSG